MKRTYVDILGDYYDQMDDQLDEFPLSDNTLKNAFKKKLFKPSSRIKKIK